MDTPELVKLSKVSDDSNKIGEFLDWLSEQGIVLCKWETPRESRRCTGVNRDIFDLDNCEGTGVAKRTIRSSPDYSIKDRDARRRAQTTYIEAGDECTKCGGTGSYEYDGAQQYLPDFMPIEKRLGLYFDIDLDKLEQERRALLEEIRAANA